MKRAGLFCTALAWALFSAPVTAQQSPPEQASSPTQQTGPNEPESPTQQSMPEATPPAPEPPPFPPMTKARPSHRHVDLGEHHTRRASHVTATVHHRTTRKHHDATRARKKTRGHREGTRAHKRTRAEEQVAHLSRNAIRRCHNMDYRQIMRSSSCRALMKQELGASERSHGHSTNRHKATKRHHSAAKHRHATTRRHSTRRSNR